MSEVGCGDVERACDLSEALAGARRRQSMEFAAGLGHRERLEAGDRYHLLGEDNQGVTSQNRLVALRGVVSIAGVREGVMAPGLEGKAFAVGQCDVKSLK